MNRFLGLLCFCLFASVNSALLGAKECTYGPSYWCASLKNAKSCGATRHCIDSVWEKQTLPKDNGEICTLCKDMVKQARDQLESKENQALLKEVFERSCRLIPIEEIQKGCITYVDDFIPELIETLASQMNPQVVCATVGLCNSARVNKLMQKYEGVLKIDLKSKAADPSNCADCETFVSDIKNMVLSYSREELLHKMLQVCGRLDSLSDGCKAIVEVNFPAIYEYLQNQLNSKQACEMFGFCDRIFGGHTTKLSHNTGDEICDFCESVVQHYKDTLVSNTTEAEFKEILDGMCHHTGHFRHECLALVNEYYQMIYNLLVSEVDAQKICTAIGLCGAASVFKNDFSTWTVFDVKPADHMPLMPLIPLEQARDENSINIYRFDIMKPRTEALSDDINIISLADTGIRTPMVKKRQNNECMMCEFVLHFLQDYLQQKHSREEIKMELDKVCRLFPHTISEQCQDYVDAYGDQMVEFLIYEMDPSTVCPMLHLCPSETTLLLSLKNIDLCVTCEFVINIFDDLLTNNVMQVEQAMKTVCTVFPSSIRPTCNSFINDYGELIIEYVEKEASPDMICTLIKLCQPSKTYKGTNYASHLLLNINEPIITKTDVGYTQSTGCVLCEFIMHELDHFLLFPATMEKIESAVERVCIVLPGGLQGDCLSFLEEYSKQLISLLVDQMDPETVCHQAKICRNTITQEMPVAAISLSVLDEKRELLGKKKCTWGPSYWCKSKWHAKSCNATKHCIEKVWIHGQPMP